MTEYERGLRDGYDKAVWLVQQWGETARESLGQPPLPPDHPKVGKAFRIAAALRSAKSWALRSR